MNTQSAANTNATKLREEEEEAGDTEEEKKEEGEGEDPSGCSNRLGVRKK